MAFLKKSVAVTPPKPTPDLKFSIGEEKDGLVWDGQTWIPKEQWLKDKK